MIRVEPVMGILRFYKDGETNDFADFIGVGTIIWVSKTEVIIKGLHGEIGYRGFMDLARWLDSQGVETVVAQRAPGRKLPAAKDLGDGTFEIKVRDVLRYDRSRNS